MSCVAVIDIGKTNAKVALVDTNFLREVEARKLANSVSSTGPYPHFDVEMLWRFIRDSLGEFARGGTINAISVSAHGATLVLLDENGALAMPVLDYEHLGPDSVSDDYAKHRPSFEETGSPRLPGGLNAGAQLFWQQNAFPDAWRRVRFVLTYPQYWSFRLTGVMRSEPTSLGAHTDLWNPEARRFCSLVEQMGWQALMAPLGKADERLGPVRPDLAASLGLQPETPVFSGIHDSNASLLPHLLARPAPFSVLSTGTWVIAMVVGGQRHALDARRDTLVNVNAHGHPVPSARFMGGREYAMLTEGVEGEASEADAQKVLRERTMLLPSVNPHSGPFPGIAAKWTPARPEAPGLLLAAAAFYLAGMSATALSLAGAQGPTVVEGPFARNGLFLRMLRAATGRPVLAGGGGTGTAVGAALLAMPEAISAFSAGDQEVPDPGPDWSAYAAAWRAAAEERRGS